MNVPITKTSRTLGLVAVALTLVASLNIIVGWPPLWAVVVIFALDALYLIYFATICFKHKCIPVAVTAIFLTLLIFAFFVLTYFLHLGS